MKGVGAFFIVLGGMGLLIDGMYWLFGKAGLNEPPDEADREQRKWQYRADRAAFDQVRLWRKARPIWVVSFVIGVLVYAVGLLLS